MPLFSDTWSLIHAELRGIDLQTGLFTIRQIKAATKNFDAANKVGEGGFGAVYKVNGAFTNRSRLSKSYALMIVLDKKPSSYQKLLLEVKFTKTFTSA